MAVSFSTLVYLPAQDLFSVPCTFYRGGVVAFGGRGIFDTRDTDVIAEDNSIYSDQKTILDIRESEFGNNPPLAGDMVVIPFDCNGKPLGQFEITDVDNNGGGELTLTLKKWERILPSLTTP